MGIDIDTLIQISDYIPRNLIISTVRQVLLASDSILYSLLGVAFSIIFAMAKFDSIPAFKQLYEEISQKVYVILGIFMLFKVTISLLTYLVNPDKMTDKEQGASKLIQRIVISLVLTIAVPNLIFPLLNRVQEPLLNTVGRVIMGNTAVINSDTALTIGQNAAINVMSTFFYPDPDCGSGADEIKSIVHLTTLADEPCSPTDKLRYRYTYTFGLSQVVGIISVIILVIIGINVAIRSWKLLVLKLIHPIPVISYVDPKSAKDGVLSSYTKLFTTTYLDLFIQFGIFYLVLLLIQKLTDMVLWLNLGASATMTIASFAFPILFIALLIFAFQAPKFIKKALNLKDSEFGTGLAGLLATGAVVAGGIGAGVGAFGTAAAKNGEGAKAFLKNMGAGLAGAISGGTAGIKTGFGSGKTDPSKVFDAINKRNNLNRANTEAGVNIRHKAAEMFGTTFMGQSPSAKKKAEVEGYDQFASLWDKLGSDIKAEATKGKYRAASFFDAAYGYGQINGVKSKEFAGAVKEAEVNNRTDFTLTMADGSDKTFNVRHAGYIQAELEKAEQADFFSRLKANEQSNDIQDNPQLLAAVQNLQNEFTRSGANTIAGDMLSGFKDIDSQIKKVKAASTTIKNSTEYLAASAAAKNK